jgi:peptide chain release factor 2
MDDLKQRIQQLKSSLNIERKQAQIDQIEAKLNDPKIWDSHAEASKLSQELSALKSVVLGWQDLSEMVMAAEDADREALEVQINDLEAQTYLSGPFDGYNAVISIHAGTGGVEAMDWAQMLARMYLRYVERRGWNVSTLDINLGEEAGYKSATYKILGYNAYGYLKGEAGVHRLVRLSPFNAQHLRQTSFALVEIVPEIEKAALDIPEKDLRIDVFRASGHGGQGVNTTDSAVRITHIPTNITVTCQNERSQMQNKETAMKILQSRLTLLMANEHAAELSKLKPQVQGSWGNQIRSYVMQPYTMVKDHRTDAESSNVAGVLEGDLDLFIDAELRN